MFKQLKLWSLLAVMVFAVACKPKAKDIPASLQVDPTSVAFTVAGEETSISIQASSNDWTASIEPTVEWLTYKKADGKLILTAKSNEMAEERTTSVVVAISSANLKRTIAVTQAGIDGSIKVQEEEYSIDSKGGEISIPVTANAPSWTAEIVEESNTWLTVTPEGDKLKVTVKPLDKGNLNGRRAEVSLSLGSSHAFVTIHQTGEMIFPKFFVKPGATRKEVKEYMSKQDGVQETKKETVLYGNSETFAGFTYNLAYETSAIAGKYLVYVFQTQNGNTFLNEASDNDVLNSIYVMGEDLEKGAERKFAEGVFEKYVTAESYQKIPDADVWYKSYEDYTLSVQLISDVLGNIGWFFKGACAKFLVRDNVSEDAGEQLSTFPIRNLNKFRVVGYKLDEATKYEAQFGLTPNLTKKDSSGNLLTQKSTVEGYTNLYKSYCFTKSSDFKSAKEGEHIMSIYYQCIPGLEGEFGKGDHGEYKNYEYNYPENEKEAGTIGKRDDIYKGCKKFFNVEKSELGEGYEKLTLKHSTISMAESLGFELVLNDSDYGIVYFVRGTDEVVQITGSPALTRISFIKSKILVDITRNNK